MKSDHPNPSVVDMSSVNRQQIVEFIDQLHTFEAISGGLFPENELENIHQLRLQAEMVLSLLDAQIINTDYLVH